MTTVHVLRNGEKVRVNDHVFVASPFETRDGVPYSIARVMEFLPPLGETGDDVKSTRSNDKARDSHYRTQIRVRVAWYYRSSELSDRQTVDYRLLLAAISTEVVPLSHLRQICHVRHRDKIGDLSAWKKKPDCFYYYRLFDAYAKREFELLRTKDITNLPPQVSSVLQSRYEYVVTDREMSGDLTGAIRHCDTCEEWCSLADAVRCDSCKRHFHMGCVQPPLLAKPTKGYSWTCAPCSKRHDDEVDRHEARRSVSPPRTTKATGTKGRGKQKDTDLANGSSSTQDEERYFRMWPYRYLGASTPIEDLLDEESDIYPVAPPRVGPRNQATLPTMLDAATIQARRQPNRYSPALVGPGTDEAQPTQATTNIISTRSKEANGIADPERGTDETMEILSCISNASPTEQEFMEKCKQRLWHKAEQRHHVDFLTEAVRRYSLAWKVEDFANVRMKGIMRHRKWEPEETRFYDKEWNDDEIKLFETGLEKYGGELWMVKQMIKTRTMAECVRFFGKWKSDRLRANNRKAAKANTILASSSHAKLTGQLRTSTHISASDDERGSVADVDESRNPPPACVFCKTRNSKSWWKAPKPHVAGVLCDDCSTAYRKYGESRHKSEEPPIKTRSAGEKREGTPLTRAESKRPKASNANGNTSTSSTPPPKKPQLICMGCGTPGPIGKVVQCQQCLMVVHACCYGVSSAEANAGDWICDLCENQKSLELSLNPDCLLCPRPLSGARPMERSYLQASKPTEGHGWAHVLCSLYVKELQFSDTSRLRLVEGICRIPEEKWKTVCSLCNRDGGVVIKCADCSTQFHASCAWRAKCLFGFELQPVKNRKDAQNITTFRNESGILQPQAWCPTHTKGMTANNSTKRMIFRFCDTNSSGESALEIYCKTSKQIPPGDSYALLRKARRLDSIIKENKVAPPPLEEPEPECRKCQTQFSPFFWPDEDGVLCHKCKTDAEQGSDSERKADDESESNLNDDDGKSESEAVEALEVEEKDDDMDLGSDMEDVLESKPSINEATPTKAKAVAASS